MLSFSGWRQEAKDAYPFWRSQMKNSFLALVSSLSMPEVFLGGTVVTELFLSQEAALCLRVHTD